LFSYIYKTSHFSLEIAQIYAFRPLFWLQITQNPRFLPLNHLNPPIYGFLHPLQPFQNRKNQIFKKNSIFSNFFSPTKGHKTLKIAHFGPFRPLFWLQILQKPRFSPLKHPNRDIFTYSSPFKTPRTTTAAAASSSGAGRRRSRTEPPARYLGGFEGGFIGDFGGIWGDLGCFWGFFGGFIGFFGVIYGGF
jgi:hypothetical protein